MLEGGRGKRRSVETGGRSVATGKVGRGKKDTPR